MHHARRLGRPRRRSGCATAQQAELLDLYGEEDIGHDDDRREHRRDAPRAGRRRARGVRRDPRRVRRREGVGELKRMFVVPAAPRPRATPARSCASSSASRGRGLPPARPGDRRAPGVGDRAVPERRATARSRTSASTRRSRSRAASPRTSGRRRRATPAAAERPTVTLTHADWDRPRRDRAAATRCGATSRSATRRSSRCTPGGFAVDDPRQGVGALSTVVAWIDGRPVGCATLRAARDGYPAGFGRAEEGLGRRVRPRRRCGPRPARRDRGRRPRARADQRGPADRHPAARGGHALPVGRLPPGRALLRLTRTTSCRSGWPRTSERAPARSRRTASTRPPARRGSATQS